MDGGGLSTTPQPRSQIGAVTWVVLLVYMGQMTLNPVIAPLARQVGLAEWQIGLTISTAAAMVVATSQFWGRRAQARGAKPVLLAATATAMAAMVGFVATAWVGMMGLLGSAAVFALFVVLRGIAFGGAIAAVPTTAQTYAARVTTTEPDRIRAMAGIGAAQGISMILGAVLGGLLAGISLLVSLVAVPLLLALGFAVAARLRPEPAAEERLQAPPRVSPADPRVWPFLLAGFGMFTSLGFIQVITGFLVQDRFGLGAEATGLATGGALLAAGVGMVVAQAVIVPKSGWPPVALLRVGSTTAAIGFLVLLPDFGPVPFAVALLLIGLGIGVASPGYTAGPSLRVDPEEQGGLAGLIGMNNGLTFVLAPSLSTLAYGASPTLPVAIGAAIMVAVVAFVTLHPGVRSASVA